MGRRRKESGGKQGSRDHFLLLSFKEEQAQMKRIYSIRSSLLEQIALCLSREGEKKKSSSLGNELGHPTIPSFFSFSLSTSASLLTLFVSLQEEDPECPLCMEEMDLSDINFKPCPCGYQVSSLSLSFLPPPSPPSIELTFWSFDTPDLSILSSSHPRQPQQAMPSLS